MLILAETEKQENIRAKNRRHMETANGGSLMGMQCFMLHSFSH